MPVILDPPFDPAAIQTNSKLALALAPSLAIFPCDDAKQPVYGVPWKSAQLGSTGFSGGGQPIPTRCPASTWARSA